MCVKKKKRNDNVCGNGYMPNEDTLSAGADVLIFFFFPTLGYC
jgi:hypothetical protein